MFSNGSSVAPKLVNSRKYLRRQIPNTWDCEPLTCNATKPSHILSNVHGMCFEDQTRRPGCNLSIVKHCNTREEHPSPIYAALPIIGKLPSLEFKSISPQYSSHTTLSFFSAFAWREDGYFLTKRLFSQKAIIFRRKQSAIHLCLVSFNFVPPLFSLALLPPCWCSILNTVTKTENKLASSKMRKLKSWQAYKLTN